MNKGIEGMYCAALSKKAERWQVIYKANNGYIKRTVFEYLDINTLRIGFGITQQYKPTVWERLYLVFSENIIKNIEGV